MSSQFDDSYENRQSGVQDDHQTEHSVYEKLARARRSYKLAQVSLNLQDRLGLAKIRYEQRYSKPSSDDETETETAPSDSIQNAAVPKSETATSADAIGATVIVPKSFSSPMIKDTFSDPFYYQQSKYPPMIHSHSLQEMEAAAAAVADPHGVGEGRRRGPFLYSDPFRHSREAPMPNPWTHKWAFSASQHMATLPFSSPTDHRYMRRHQSYPGGGGGVGVGVGRRWTYDHTDGIRERDTVLQKHDPMLPSVPAFGVEDDCRRPSSNSMNCSMSPSPRTPPPKRQRTASIAPGKPVAGAGAAGENGADLLLYLANSPQGSSSASSSGFPYSKHTHAHTQAPYIHSFNAANYHPYASSMHGMSSDIPSTPPSRHNTAGGGYAPSSSLYSTPLPSSTIPTTPLSRLTTTCGGSNHNTTNTPFNFADYVNVTPSPAQPQPQPQTQRGTAQEETGQGQGQGQGQPPPPPSSVPQQQQHQRQLSIRIARFRSPSDSPGAFGNDDGAEETTPSKKCRRKDNVLTPGPPLKATATAARQAMNRRDLKSCKQGGVELMRVGSLDSDGTIPDGEGGDDVVVVAAA